MNPASTTFFNKHLQNLEEKYEGLGAEIQSHKKENRITSHYQGDQKYYQLCIQRLEIYIDIKRTEAILEGKEFSFIRYHKPVALNKIRQLKDLEINAKSKAVVE